MDTATHIAMGVAVGGLATIDPVVQQQPELFQAVFIGAIIGSHAPDFDTFFKFRNNATYIRQHRGWSHSPIAVLFWSVLITFCIYFFYDNISLFNLWLWIFISVVLHVFVDIFNAYGTQALKPFVNKWIALGWIHTFDPFIFFIFVAGSVAWALGADPRYTFLIVFFILTLYYIKRYFDKREITKILYDYFDHVEKVITQPTIKHNVWRIVVETHKHYYVAESNDGYIYIHDKFIKKDIPETKEMKVAMEDANIQSFIDFSPIYRYEIEKKGANTEIRFIDLRYRSKGRYPFVAVVILDRHYNVLNSHIGWIYSEDKLQKKLEPLS
mgnify:CR=1 FL=1